MRAETSWPRRGRAYWTAAVIATLIVVSCSISALRWWNRPFPGFFLWENGFVPAVGDSDWSGAAAGVPYQWRLVAVDGQPLAGAAAAYRAAAAVPLGTALHYTFVSPRGAPLTLAVPTMRLVPVEFLLTLGNYLAVGAVLTLLGFVVYFLRPDAPGARAMLAAGATWGLYLVTAADIFGPAWLRPLCLVLQALGPVTLVHLALTFPVERAALRRSWLLPGLYLAGLAVGIADNLAFHRAFAVLLAVDRFNSIALIASGVLLIASLADALRHPPSAAARQRTKIAALGGVAAFAIPVAGFVAYYLLGVRFPLNFTTFSMLLFPLAIGYAIVQHDLFEVDAIIRRAVAWAILSGFIVGAYLAGIGALDVLFGGGNRVAQVLFLLAIAALINPLRERVQAGVDALFARRRYDYRGTVTDVSASLARLLDRDAIVAQLLDTITATMQVDFGAVWLRDGDGGYRRYAQAGSGVAANSPDELRREAPLPRQLEVSPQQLWTDEGAAFGEPIAASVVGLGASLIVPIAFQGTARGFLALGRKASGYYFSGEDRGLLQTLASQAAVALENAASYRALERVNEELRGAQAQLIQAERFAAIGEVSAAVAHGIRNPLAGIKAAARVAGLEIDAAHPAHETIADIIGESNRLEARIKALLDFARPFEPHRAPCRVEALIDEARHALRAQIAAASLHIATEIEPGLPAVSLDPGQIVEVLLVLVANAIEVMPNGGELGIRARREDAAHLRLEVSDSGPGIAPAQQARLFQLFATTKPSGNGLGLAMAKKIVERHGGTIAADSAPGAGTCFRVVLPIG
ncbi:MAG: ATP-binding protein [bacterium]